MREASAETLEDEKWMAMAVREAEKAAADGEVPTGCVIVDAEGRILGRAHNQTEGLSDATAHAEMLALSAAFAVRGNWRLTGCRLYVTKEPCPMCTGAIVLSRIATVVWGVSDPKRGGFTVFDIFRHPGVNHHPEVRAGLLEGQSRAILQEFFRRRRAEREAMEISEKKGMKGMTTKPTLVVLAAGMGSRYGGLKQVDPVGPCGEAILDYSVFDAIRGGFGKVVFVIRHDFEDEFREKVGKKYEGHIPVEYCFQDINDLPDPYKVPKGRTKPWGTAHATRAARTVVDEPFAVINADDFYGRDAFAKLGVFLASAKPMQFAMVGYRLDLTLSENGSVARGICSVESDGTLSGVTEMTKLVRVGDVAQNQENPDAPVEVPLDARVSMNLWGFTTGLFAALEDRFPAWLAENGAREKSEWYIPFVVDELIKDGNAVCHVLPTDSSWFGVTYREDKPRVMASIKSLVDAGEYPAPLFA